jgi:hypothetical protein
METLPMYFSVDDVRDTIFSDFCHISQNQCYDKMFEKTSSILSKKTAHIFTEFLGENILKLPTSVPGSFSKTFFVVFSPRFHTQKVKKRAI